MSHAHANAPGPKRLGAYDVVAKIARGGMATIYLGRAREPGVSPQVAAIKVIKPELARQDDFVKMFVDEANILARLHHPNLSSALENGATGAKGNERYIVMDLLMGRSALDVWQVCVDRGVSFGLDLAAWICARIADGLHHAHEIHDDAGESLHLIHRDVTPSNLFLTYDGQVKLVDFGLAKAKGRLHMTKSGVVKGKVSYFSPEQLVSLALDRRCDIYTLGVTLWEMTTMKRLYQRDTDLEVVRAIQSGVVQDPREIQPSYPADLWAIVKKALAHDRDARYATAEELAKDLDQFVGADAQQMPAALGGLLETLFPGEKQRQQEWLERTSAASSPGGPESIPPPVPTAPMPAGSRRSIPPPLPKRARS